MLQHVPNTESQYSQDPEGLLRIINAGEPFDFFCRHWLSTQCQHIDHVALCVLILKEANEGTYRSVAKWPATAKVAHLSELAEGTLRGQRTLITKIQETDNDKYRTANYALAVPVSLNGEPFGVIALALRVNEQMNLRPIITQLEYACGWLELSYQRNFQTGTDSTNEKLQAGVKLLAKIHSERHFLSAAMTLVTELAAHLQCDRVSFGIPHKGKIIVKAFSHSAQFGKKQNLMTAIANAMQEALVLGREVHCIPGKNLPGETNDTLTATHDTDITPDHLLLGNEFGSQTLLTIPVFTTDAYVSVVTLERDRVAPFTEREIDYCQSILSLVAPAIEDKRQNDRAWIVKTKDSITDQLHKFVSPQHATRKIITALVTIAIIFFTFAKGEHKVVADTKIEGQVQRVLAAPFNGYIKTADYRAGDIVKRGDTISQLDERDLRIERIKAISQKAQYEKQHQNALANSDRAEASIVKAQIQQVDAQLALIENQLQRANLQAPFDAIIISGDLSQKLGSSVKQGDQLFVVAPLDRYRIILKVDEHRIGFVKSGQTGYLVLNTFPNKKFQFEIKTVTPATENLDGKNVFRVEAELLDNADQLQPGMEGIGKVIIGEEHLIVSWTRSLREWLTLVWWRWVG